MSYIGPVTYPAPELGFTVGWETGCVFPTDFLSNVRMGFACVEGTHIVSNATLRFFADDGDVDCTGSPTIQDLPLVDYTCDPFHMHWHAVSLPWDIYVDG